MSLQVHQEALAADPQDLRALLGLAAAHGDRGEYAAGLASCELALALDPQCVTALAVQGGLLAALGRYADAVATLDRALLLGPDCPAARWNRAGARLALGDYAGGWDDYEWGKVNRMRPLRTLRPTWDGKPLPGGTLLLWAEQGAGDTLQFVRFVAAARERSQAARVLVEAPEALVPLLHGQVPGDVYASSPASDLPYHCDAHASLMSLPYLLGVTLADVPSAPYLIAKGRATLPAGDRRRVGFAWRGNSSYPLDRDRSIHDAAPLEALADVPGVRWFNLQLGHAAPPWTVDLTPGINDWTHTAALLQELDLFITVDTGIAHLSAALGVPTWIMLTAVPDWRWLTKRDDSPWYASVRLFRQQQRGDWTGVVARVAAALQELD